MMSKCFGLVLSLASLGAAVNADQPQPPAQQESKVTIQDLDRQIQFLKDNIEKYNSMANAFDRKASSLQSHDFTGYRDAAAVRDECRSIASDLQKHMETLEQQRATLEKQKSAN
jgi:prefoldin subunit 5